MAAKNCPGCSKQVPVACKKCGCGHSFFTARRPNKTKKNKDDVSKKEKVPSTATAKGSPAEVDVPLPALRQPKSEDRDLPRRRTGRVQREKPNFYDALEYENQMRKLRKMRLLKGKPKGEEARSKEKDRRSSSDEAPTQKEPKSEPAPPPQVKKRRGRPPRLTTTKGQAAKGKAAPAPLTSQPKLRETSTEAFDDFVGITPEKALQFNIILGDINRKWVTVGWRV